METIRRKLKRILLELTEANLKSYILHDSNYDWKVKILAKQ